MIYSLPIISLLCLISAAITFSLGIFVFARNPKSHVHQLFLFLCCSGAFWAFFEFMLRQATDPSFAYYWNMIGSEWILTVPVAIHFILLFTSHPLSRKSRLPIILLLFYAPAFVFLIYDAAHAWTYHFTFIEGYGYDSAPGPEHLLYIPEIIFAFTVAFIAIITCIWSYHKTPGKDRKLRRQILLVLMGISFPSGAGLIGIIFFSNISNGLSVAVAISYLGFVICISLAILRYGLFIVSPTTAAETIIATIPDALILTTHDGKIITINPAGLHLMGIEKGINNSRQIRNFIEETDFIRLKQKIEQKGSISDEEILFRGGFGPVPVSIAASEVKDPDGKPAGLVYIIRDITDRKASERALIQAREKLALMYRITRHDILNLLTAMTGYLCIAEEKAEPLDESLTTDIRACQSLADRIADHIRITGTYPEQYSGEMIWQSLDSLIRRLIQEMSSTIHITADIREVEILADPLIYKVFYNIAENSVRHGENATLITCESAIIHDSFILIMEDNGKGVLQEEKLKIFEPGFGKNTGLGLSFCRDILSYSGISIRETGQAGIGARFEILFPLGTWRENNSGPD
ncbi:histidine kinase N-terminal 7TM domain-containing protein [Methanospirillum hungatei]|uniref:histidine kinase N-terminal 7TM domain-containing protein n=1 Tax=Methanospirillum hungatei TaxID=2203 RepID=UPI0026EB20C0|nr:histidine kinase N-terminal 7TM domain-containing protein [Methanospirillum hungatei]MCA1916882.1 PAS domain S-box protein [Methanospirillum hungatei]